MADMMTFADTWEAYEDYYGFTDVDEVYSNGARMIPSFRVKQWLDHLEDKPRTIHKLKILKQYADAIADGRKAFEVRLNDRGYNAGDYVTFIVRDSMGVEVTHHTLEEKVFEITYVHSGLGMENGYVVFGIKERKDGN